MDDKGKFAIKPIRFSNINHLGTIGSDRMATDYSLSKLLTQNILYSTYKEAKKITDIAYLLDVNTSLIEEIVEHLEDNGFITKVDCEKYITNILIHDLSKETLEKKHLIYKEYAGIVCKEYIPLLIETILSNKLKKNLYIPLNDLNVLKWTIITFALYHKFSIPEIQKSLSKFYIKQNDGSEYITFATIEHDFNLSYNENLYRSSGEVIFSYGNFTYYPFIIWIYNSYYNDKFHDWSIYAESGFMNLYDFLVERFTNYLDKNEVFDSLRSKGFVIPYTQSKKDEINMIIAKMQKGELISALPDMPKNFITLNQNISSEIYNLCNSEYPLHLQELCSAFYANSLSNSDLILRVIEQLLENGTLTPLSEIQKKTVNMIMFSEILP